MKKQLYLNTTDSNELTDRVLAIINSANTYIKTGNFFFREPKIMEALKSAVQRGIVLFVLSNIKGYDEEGCVDIDEEFQKIDSDPHLPNLAEVVEIGGHVRCMGELHAKFILSDNGEGLVMSSNYTIDSLHGNPECGAELGLKDQKRLEQLFDTLFTYADIRLKGYDKDGYVFRKEQMKLDVAKLTQSDSNILLTLGPNDPKRITNFSNCNIHTIYDAIVDAINEANEHLTIVSYSFKDLDSLPEFTSALSNAYKRGVKIQLLFRSDHEKSASQLRDISQSMPEIKRIGIPKNHAKLLVTEQQALLFTANIDGSAGMKGGFELGVRLNAQQYKEASDIIEQLKEYSK